MTARTFWSIALLGLITMTYGMSEYNRPLAVFGYMLMLLPAFAVVKQSDQ